MKPLGIKFARGSDGGAYVTRSDPDMGNTDKMVQVDSSLLYGCHNTMKVVNQQQPAQPLIAGAAIG